MPEGRNASEWVITTLSSFPTQLGTLIGLFLGAVYVIISIFLDSNETKWFVTFVVLSLMAISSWLIGERITAASQVVQVAAPQLVDAVRTAVREGLAHEGPEFLENERRLLERAISVIDGVKRGHGPHSPEEKVRATSLFMSSDPRVDIQKVKADYFTAVADLCKSGNYRYQVVMTTKDRKRLQNEIDVRTKAFDSKYGEGGWSAGTEFDPRYVEDQSGLEVLIVGDHVLFNIMRSPGDRPQRAGIYFRDPEIADVLREWYDNILVPTAAQTLSPGNV